MGCSSSAPVVDIEARQITSVIDRELKHDKERLAREIKLLLLGAGESGKSSVAKQMRILHCGSFSEQERRATIEIIYQNVIQSMQVILDWMNEVEMPLADMSLRKSANTIKQLPKRPLDGNGRLPAPVIEAIAALWTDSNVRDAALNRSREFQLNDSAPYFFTEIKRFSATDYLPTDEDILRARVKTTGILETQFEMGKVTYRMLDVGGQRSERRKWVHCFEDCTAIILYARSRTPSSAAHICSCIALSDYPLMIREDGTTNRMSEALMLFESIVCSRWFESTAFVVFLNKIDLFQGKVLKTPIADYFPEYKSFKSDKTEEWERGADFFKRKVLACDRKGKDVYIHYTCAIDSELMRKVIASVNDTIMRSNLSETGIRRDRALFDDQVHANEMGNSQSSEAVSDKVARPALQARGLSSSSTATIKTSKSSSTAGKEGPRRRSIDLPDVYGGLALTPASPTSPSDEMPSSSKGGWPRRGNSGRKGAAPSSKITKAGPTVSSTLASVASSGAGTSTSVSAPTTVVQPQAPTQSIGMALDAAESQAAYEAQMGIGEESRVDIDQAPEEVKEDAAQQSEGLAPALPLKGLNAFPILPLLSPDKATPPSLPPSLPVMPPPLTPPLATVVAPLIPASIVPLPLGTGASTTASLIVGQPLPIIARARTTSYEPPSPTGILELQAREPPRAHSPSSPPVVVDEAHAAGGIIPIGLPQANFPLPANYADAPVAAVMPAAAPIAGQNAALANDPQAQEAVIQATVDLEAGPDAVPTLITWRPVEGAGGEGTVAGSGAPPKSVYVTGTFSRGWSTKIEMRKKKSADDFTALVALPPGQHQLKFIVDKEWQTSRNLPSATDGEGNLINYLIVRGPTTPAPIYNMGWNEDADDGEEWGTEVPSPIAGLGAELDAWEAARDAQGKEVPRPYRISMLESLKPPLLPAPLKDVPLNKSQIVAQGSGDDNSILHKPDHSILDHLCASPISRGLLSVAATKRYRRKFVTIMYIRPMEKDGETAPTS